MISKYTHSNGTESIDELKNKTFKEVCLQHHYYPRNSKQYRNFNLGTSISNETALAFYCLLSNDHSVRLYIKVRPFVFADRAALKANM